MRRYLAFGGEYEPKQFLGDLLGSYDELVIAKAAVDVCDPEGWPTHVRGCVLDTKLDQIHGWQAEPGAFGRVMWRNPRTVYV